MAVITVEELFRLLSYGELSNLAVGIDATGTIKKEEQNRIVAFANEALTRLHSRFVLIEEAETIELVSGQDLDHELDGDVIQVISLLTPYGESLTIGNKKIAGTVYVAERKLHIPSSVSSLVSEVQTSYQKRHPVLTPVHGPGSTNEDPEVLVGLAQEISLPQELHEALTAYIAQKVYSTKNSQDSMAIAASHRQRYEQVIAEALNQGVLPGELLRVQKLEARGFV